MSASAFLTGFGIPGVVAIGDTLWVKEKESWTMLIERLRALGFDVENSDRPGEAEVPVQSVHLGDAIKRRRCLHCGALISMLGSHNPAGRRCEACGRTIYASLINGGQVHLAYESLRDIGDGGTVRDRAEFGFTVRDFHKESETLLVEVGPLPRDLDPDWTAHERLAAFRAEANRMGPFTDHFRPVSLISVFEPETDRLRRLPAPQPAWALDFNPRGHHDHPYVFLRANPPGRAYLHSEAVWVYEGTVLNDPQKIPAPQSFRIIPAWSSCGYPLASAPDLHSRILQSFHVDATVEGHLKPQKTPVGQRFCPAVPAEKLAGIRAFIAELTELPVEGWDTLVATHGREHTARFILEMAAWCHPDPEIRWAWQYGAVYHTTTLDKARATVEKALAPKPLTPETPMWANGQLVVLGNGRVRKCSFRETY